MDLDNAYFTGEAGLPDPQEYRDMVVDYCPECGESIWLYQDVVLYNHTFNEVVGCSYCVKVDPNTYDYISKIDGQVLGYDTDSEFLQAQEVY